MTVGIHGSESSQSSPPVTTIPTNQSAPQCTMNRATGGLASCEEEGVGLKGHWGASFPPEKGEPQDPQGELVGGQEGQRVRVQLPVIQCL